MPLFVKKIKGGTIIKQLKTCSFHISRHTVKRIKERYGEKYCDGKKIKNMSVGRIRKIILNQLRYHLVKKQKANITNYYVQTELFSFILDLEYGSIIKTALPGENHYNDDSGLSCTLGESCEALKKLKKAM